jgi:probable phosphoglycerate mutase
VNDLVAAIVRAPTATVATTRLALVLLARRAAGTDRVAVNSRAAAWSSTAERRGVTATDADRIATGSGGYRWAMLSLTQRFARARWPHELMLVRHGESAGNVARDLAEGEGRTVIDIAERDMDVDLSARGELQARALGTWLAERSNRPTVVLASPYVRARRTAELAVSASGLHVGVVLDERLREREFGALDRLTHAGIAERFPAEAELRARVGKFYHRPPGGESWCDVGLRVRSALDSITRAHRGERVMVVAHEVVIHMFRYVLENLSEQEVLALSRKRDLPNCSVTRFVADRGHPDGMRLDRVNEIDALVEGNAPVTHEPDVAVAPR